MRLLIVFFFFFSSRRRHTRLVSDWSSDVCSSDLKVDRSPVLALTGQVDTQVLGPGAFQEVDLSGAFGSVAAWSQPVLHDSNPVELMNLACKNALLRRDVAHLIFPDGVQTLPAPEGAE